MRCPECGSERIAQVGHDTLCRQCGLILEDMPLVPGYVPQTRKNAAEAPEYAVAGTFGVDGRLVKRQWLLTAKEKNVIETTKRIKDMAAKLHLSPGLTEQASRLYRKAVFGNLCRGRDNTSIAAACLYAACQMAGVPRIPIEISLHTGVEQTPIMRAYRLLIRHLSVQVAPMRPEDLLPRFANRLRLPPEVITRAFVLLEEQSGLSRHPQTMAAAALYVAAKEMGVPLTQREVANKTGVIEVTIRKAAHALSVNPSAKAV